MSRATAVDDEGVLRPASAPAAADRRSACWSTRNRSIVERRDPVVAGAITWFTDAGQLSDEKIVVSDDADNFAGDTATVPSPPVRRPR